MAVPGSLAQFGHANAGELQLTMQSGNLGKVAQQAVERLDEDHVELVARAFALVVPSTCPDGI